ncbi:MAG: NAD(P)-dependent malic enzyme [Anaerovoracaceae bacterium]|jgi:malate dehydrogenase (oxaloacetate-decarboxylating)
MDYYAASLAMHEKYRGKMEVKSKVGELKTKDDLSTAYTPGVAEPCRRINKDPEDVFRYTNKSNTVAVISDGSAVLGLGNIGASAAIPVMDGKSLLFKEFGGIDAFPICLETQDVDEIVMICKNIAPTLGGINLEDISAPRCFEIEEKLQAAVDIPVFHDDQHGTAVVVSAGVINAFKLTDRKFEDAKVVINGAGSAGTAIAKMLMSLGVRDIVVCDSKGILNVSNYELNAEKMKLAQITNPDNLSGDLKRAVAGRDLFIGVSAPGVLTESMVKTMAKDPVVFAMANPEPEILPDAAKKAGVAVMGTGRSDFPNQVNNVLAFPGIFKGALSVRAKRITEDMKKAAAYALAGIIRKKDLSPDNIIPSAFEPGVADIVAEAVATAWEE